MVANVCILIRMLIILATHYYYIVVKLFGVDTEQPTHDELRALWIGSPVTKEDIFDRYYFTLLCCFKR